MVLGSQKISSQPQGLSSAAPTSGKGPANFAAVPNIVNSFSSLSNLEPPALPAPASASPHTQGRHRRASSLNSVFQPDHSSSATAVDATADTALTQQSSLHSLACPTAGPATLRHTSDTSRCPFPDCTMRPSLAAYFKHVSQHIQGYFSGGPVEPCAEWLAHFGKVICPTCRSLFSAKGMSTHARKCKGSHLRAPPARLTSADEPDNRNLPDLDEIFLNITPVVHVIPARDVVQVGRIVQSELHNLQCNPNSSDALARVFMVLKCIIPGSTRAGKHHAKSQISAKCNLWSSGRIMELWDLAVATSDHLKARASARKPKLQEHQSSAGRSAAASRLAGEGCLAKAIAALSSDGVAPMTRATFQKLESKHPDAPLPEFDAAAPIVTDVTLPSDFDLVAALRSFPRNTSAGPSGLRAHHLLQFCNAPLQFSFVTTLRNFVNSMLSGTHFPPSVAKYFAGGSLTALLKLGKGVYEPDDPDTWDVRPICVGETLRRLVSKCVCALSKKRAADYLSPSQLGVACPGGLEFIIHRTREVVAAHANDPDFVLLKVDFRNAFNAVSRRAILEECAAIFPEFLPWVRFCYSGEAVLSHPLGSLSSKAGVQQGDPLGPLLFSLVLHRIVKMISSRAKCANLLLNLWYMDDGIIAGPARDVRKALRLIAKYGPDLGLNLNLSKCELFCSSVETLEQHDFPIQRAKNDGNIPVSTHFNFIALGSPIGSSKFCESWVSAANGKADILFERLKELNDPHTATLLLSSCCSFGKFVHVVRTVPLSHTRHGLARFDSQVLECFAAIVGDTLPAPAKLQASLARSRGGLGLRSLVRHANAAFVSSFCRALPGSTSNTSLARAAEQLRQELRPDLPSHLAFIVECGSTPQAQFSALLEDRDLSSLAASFYNSFPDLARLNSVCAPHSSTWLEVPPTKGLGLHLSPPHARTALKLRLGLQLFEKAMFCDKCDLKLLDPHGHHALTCKCMGSRHNRVADVLFDFLRLGQFRPSKEMGACANDLDRPADILVPGLSQNGSQDLAIDVTVVSALSQSALVESALTLDGSGAVHLAELKKHEENDAKCLRMNWECLPFALDTYGRFGDESEPFLQVLASRVAAQSGVSRATALRSIRGKLGVTLMRANGDAIIAARPLPTIDGKVMGPADLQRMGSPVDLGDRSSHEPRILPCSLSSLSVSPWLPAVPRSEAFRRPTLPPPQRGRNAEACVVAPSSCSSLGGTAEVSAHSACGAEGEADRPEPASLLLSVDQRESERYYLSSFSLPAPSVYAESVSSSSVGRCESERYSFSSFSSGSPAPAVCAESVCSSPSLSLCTVDAQASFRSARGEEMRAMPSESELSDPVLRVSSPVAIVTVLGAEPLYSEGSECVKRVGGAFGPP